MHWQRYRLKSHPPSSKYPAQAVRDGKSRHRSDRVWLRRKFAIFGSWYICWFYQSQRYHFPHIFSDLQLWFESSSGHHFLLKLLISWNSRVSFRSTVIQERDTWSSKWHDRPHARILQPLGFMCAFLRINGIAYGENATVESAPMAATASSLAASSFEPAG